MAAVSQCRQPEYIEDLGMTQSSAYLNVLTFSTDIKMAIWQIANKQGNTACVAVTLLLEMKENGNVTSVLEMADSE